MEDFEENINKNIKQQNDEMSKHIDKIKEEIHDVFGGFSEMVNNIADIKQKMFDDRLTAGIQISCLRDEIKEGLKSLREDLWYQCDHMKFVNLIDSKFKQFESKFEQYIYEPNRIKFDKKSEDNFDKTFEAKSKNDMFEHNDYNSIEEFLKDDI